jgi:alkylation response protein AidB-like acyl-CoA dehydrogenase
VLGTLRFPPPALADTLPELRREVQELLDRERAAGTWEPGERSWSGFNPELSRRLGARGFIGMTWPERYGGGERTYLERYVVTEQLLAAGAPTAAHWVADRQSGPLLLRFGSEQQRQSFLPRIARGEAYFSIGMSEPDSGSDLASIRSRADPVDGGFELTGTKVWTSGAHRTHHIIVLCRTEPPGADRHAGMSQLLVDLDSPGIGVRPISNLMGQHELNEVVFDRVFVPAERLIGELGAGWRQVTSELAYERAGPERFLTNFHLLRRLVGIVGDDASPTARRAVGRLVAHLWTLRRMSLSVAGLLEAGEMPATESALVKDLGTAFQQELPEVCRALVLDLRDEGRDREDDELRAFVDSIERETQRAPAYTIQGGTTEILRGIVARGLRLR